MNAQGWHNFLPDWIKDDLAERPIRQGPRATLQAMANRCDAPEAEDAPLLVCLGGDSLIRACGCSKSAFWQHVRSLKKRGYIVPLSRGAGRLASAYGIPGRPGELDGFRAKSGDGPHRWDKSDTQRIRRLVSENRALALCSDESDGIGNRTPALHKPDGGRPEIGVQPPENRTLPSHTPSSRPSELPSALLLPEPSKDDAKALLGRLNELEFGKPMERTRLVRDHPKAVSEALAKLDRAVADGRSNGRPVRNPAGLLRTLLADLAGPGAGALAKGLAGSMSAGERGKRTDIEAERKRQIEALQAAAQEEN